jgi:hypothetical protein
MKRFFPFILFFIFSPELAGQQTFFAIEDSYIRGGTNAGTNYGTSTTLELKSAPNFEEFSRKVYLKFDISGWDESIISSAILFIRPESVSNPFFASIFLTSDQWNEENINWNNAPSPNMIIDSVELKAAGNSYGIEITSAFFQEYKNDGILSLVIEDKSITDELARINSRENSQNPPRIVLLSGTDTLVESPELKSVEFLGGTGILLNWIDRSKNETAFIIEKKTNEGLFTPVDTTLFNQESFLDNQAVIGSKYTYRVKALNPFLSSEYSAELHVDLTATDVPGKIDDFSGKALSSGKIDLKWNCSESVSGFIISRKNTEDGFEIIDTVQYCDSTYLDTGRNPNTSYEYFLKAYNYLGASLPSDTISILTTNSKTFYFDATNGNDSYKENTIETPWQSLAKINETIFDPGDSVLLKAGEKWEGTINLNGSGAENYPITLSRYGEGERPIINGKGAEGPVITLRNVSHWNLSSLEITNPSTLQASRVGVLITATGGNQGHFHLDNLYIHDIFGRYTFEMIGKNTGGIGIIGENDTRFDNILIENSEITDIVRVGIFTNGNTGTRGDRPITNLVIRNNTLTRCAGDGMIIRYAYRPIIEHNLAIENHNALEELVNYGVAIWVRSTDEAIIQYNRVFDTKGSKDGQAFDADLDAWRTLVQYNYSANNEGGFMLVYGSSQDAIVRYNISQNDGSKGKHLLDFPVWVSPRGSGIIHNNVFYIDEGNDAVLVDEALPTAKLYNNIVINKSGGALVIRSEGQTAEFSNNCLVGYSESETARNQNPVTGNPDLINPGSGETEFSSLEGYKLSEGSPCLGAGIPVSEMGGNYWYKEEMHDFWGNPINPEFLDVGVHQRSGLTGIKLKNLENDRLEWKVSPNPFDDSFFLSLNLPFPLEIEVKLFDLTGRYLNTLYNGEMQDGSNIFFFSLAENKVSTATGMFLLQVTAPKILYKQSQVILQSTK